MKKLILLSIVALFSIGMYAQDKGLGLGLVFGEPTGLSAKLWTSERTTFDAALAWSSSGVGWFHMQSDFLIHNYELLSVSKGALPVYFGGGGYIAFSSDLGLGIRVPFGIAYQFEGSPVDVFAEIAPGLSLLPDLGFYFGGGIGIRYFF